MHESEITDELLLHYEGLCRKTASMIVGIVEEDFDDIVQLLRIKCWRALVSFDTAKARQPRDGYVFMCVQNFVKDLVKRKRRNLLFIEDIAPANTNGSSEAPPQRDSFEARYLAVFEDDAYASVESDRPALPPTLDQGERRVLVHLYLGFPESEVAVLLGIKKKELTAVVETIQEKLREHTSAANGDREALPLAA